MGLVNYYPGNGAVPFRKPKNVGLFETFSEAVAWRA
jgi:hypothetical protein